MTLIEVLAGLIVLGTLLASVGIARGRFLRQWADADRKITVARASDALLAQWMAGPPESMPIPAQGSLTGAPGFDWQTRVLPGASLIPLQVVAVRLDIYDHRATNSLRSRRFTETPVLSIDFLVHHNPAGGRANP